MKLETRHTEVKKIFLLIVVALTSVQSQSSNNLDALLDDAENEAVSIAYEADKTSKDRSHYCNKIRNKAEEIILEASDAYEEIYTDSPTITVEVEESVNYIMRQASAIISTADSCENETRQTDQELDQQLQTVEEEFSALKGSNDDVELLAETKSNVRVLQCKLKTYSHAFAVFAGSFIEHAENIVTASRDLLSMVEEDRHAKSSTYSDAKDSKDEMKELAQDIIDYAEEMLDSNDELGHRDAMKGVDTMKAALDAYEAQT